MHGEHSHAPKKDQIGYKDGGHYHDHEYVRKSEVPFLFAPGAMPQHFHCPACQRYLELITGPLQGLAYFECGNCRRRYTTAPGRTLEEIDHA